MKKVFVMIFLLLLISPICFAQSGVSHKDVKLDGNKLDEAKADLSQIEIGFCDKPGEKQIIYTLAPGWNQDICLKATNMSSKDIETTIWFVDGTVTNDQRKNKACMQEGEDKDFGRYVTGFAASFTIPANGSLFQHAIFTLPKWATGTVNWCLVFYTKSVAMGGNLNFSVLMRKAKFIDIQVKEKSFLKKNIFWILIILLLVYYTKIFIFPKTKKLPQR